MTKSQKILFVDTAADLVLRLVTYSLIVTGLALIVAAGFAAAFGLI
jgi:hypothetical protein